eukprot:gene16125-9952_t
MKEELKQMRETDLQPMSPKLSQIQAMLQKQGHDAARRDREMSNLARTMGDLDPASPATVHPEVYPLTEAQIRWARGEKLKQRKVKLRYQDVVVVVGTLTTEKQRLEVGRRGKVERIFENNGDALMRFRESVELGWGRRQRVAKEHFNNLAHVPKLNEPIIVWTAFDSENLKDREKQLLEQGMKGTVVSVTENEDLVIRFDELPDKQVVRAENFGFIE